MTEVEIGKLEAAIGALPKGPYRECGHDRGGCRCGQVHAEGADVVLLSANTNSPDEGVEWFTTEEVKSNARNLAIILNALPDLIARIRSLEAKLEEAGAVGQTIYVVRGQSGSYDDYQEWPVIARTDEASAQQLVAALNARVSALAVLAERHSFRGPVILLEGEWGKEHHPEAAAEYARLIAEHSQVDLLHVSDLEAEYNFYDLELERAASREDA